MMLLFLLWWWCISEYAEVTAVQAAVVAELRKQYSRVALFFWDARRGDVLGVVWKPKAFLSSTSTSSSFSILESRHQLVVTGVDNSGDCVSGGGVKHSTDRDSVVVKNVVELVAEMVAGSKGAIDLVQIR